MYECSKSNGNIVVKTKNTCYFPLDRVWNIHVETTENSISRFLDFNIFWGSKLPQETPRGSRLWRWQYFPLLRNIRISTNTPSQTPATRLFKKFIIKKVLLPQSHSIIGAKSKIFQLRILCEGHWRE